MAPPVLFAVWVFLFATGLLLHLALLWVLWRDAAMPTRLKLLAVMPCLTPWLAYQRGARLLPVAWGTVLALYLATRVFGAQLVSP